MAMYNSGCPCCFHVHQMSGWGCAERHEQKHFFLETSKVCISQRLEYADKREEQ